MQAFSLDMIYIMALFFIVLSIFAGIYVGSAGFRLADTLTKPPRDRCETIRRQKDAVYLSVLKRKTAR